MCGAMKRMIALTLAVAVPLSGLTPAFGAVVPTAGRKDVAQSKAGRDKAVVSSKLRSQGYSQEAADTLVSKMSPEERRQVAQHPEVLEPVRGDGDGGAAAAFLLLLILVCAAAAASASACP